MSAHFRNGPPSQVGLIVAGGARTKLSERFVSVQPLRITRNHRARGVGFLDEVAIVIVGID